MLKIASSISWSRGNALGSRRNISALSLAAALLLGGCGFHPVYAPASSGAPGVAAQGLSQVSVGPLYERSGQLLRDALERRIDGVGGTSPKLYELVVSYGVSLEGVAIDASDSISTRTRATANATWTLVSMDADRRSVTAGRARVADGFNPLDNQFFYGDLQNEQLQRRVADATAEQITTQLAVYFRTHPPGA